MNLKIFQIRGFEFSKILLFVFFNFDKPQTEKKS